MTPLYFAVASGKPIKVIIPDPPIAAGRPLDAFFLRQAGIQIYYPTSSTHLSNPRLLRESLISTTGITLVEFGKIYKACYDCGRYVYAVRPSKHSCYAGEVDVKGTGFCLFSYLYSDKYGGLTMRDLEKVYHACETCLRIFPSALSPYHCCS